MYRFPLLSTSGAARYNLPPSPFLLEEMNDAVSKAEALTLVRLLIQQGHYAESGREAAKQILLDFETLAAGFRSNASFTDAVGR